MPTIRPISAQEWKALVADFRDQNFEQTPAYGDAAARRIGGTPLMLAVEEAGKVVALAHVRIKTIPGLGRGIAWIPSGPLTLRGDADPPDVRRLAAILGALRQHLSVQAGHILRLRLPGQALHDPALAEAALTRAGFRPTDRAAVFSSALIDLTLDEETLRAQLATKWRSNLKHAMAAGFEVETGDTPDLRARFLRLYDEVRKAKGFQVDIPPEFHFDLAGPDYRVEVLLTRLGAVDAGASVLCIAGPSVTHLFAATGEAGRENRGGYFLTWSTIAHGRAMGGKTFEVGGIDISGVNPEVARYKERLNGARFVLTPYETDAGGLVPALIRKAERLHARLRARD